MSVKLGIIVPTNDPDSMHQYLQATVDNLLVVKDYIKFLINFQKPWTEEGMKECVANIKSKGFEVEYKFSEYIIKGKGMIPMNKIREDAASIDKSCDYYLLSDDDMSFNPPSQKINRSSGEQLLQCIAYMKTHPSCGVIVFGSSLIKKIKLNTIAQISNDRDYITGRGLLVRNISNKVKSNNVLIPDDAYELVGSDEEKIAAGWRISEGYYVAEIPFSRNRHAENQCNKRNKKGKVAGTLIYEWNTDEIRNENNFKYIRDHYNESYVFGKGNIVNYELYKSKGGEDISDSNTMDFSSMGTQDIFNILEGGEVK